MDLEEIEKFDQLVTLIRGYANLTRLALLLGFYQGYTAQDVADFLDISRPGVQKNIEQMVKADLVFRPAADEAPTYALTPLGEFFARIYDAYGPALLTAAALLRQTEATVRQQLQDSPMATGLSEAEKEKLVHTRKWQEVNDQITDLLGLDTHDPAPSQAGNTPSRAFGFDASLSAEEIADILNEAREDDE